MHHDDFHDVYIIWGSMLPLALSCVTENGHTHAVYGTHRAET